MSVNIGAYWVLLTTKKLPYIASTLIGPHTHAYIHRKNVVHDRYAYQLTNHFVTVYQAHNRNTNSVVG